jgi:3-deoxy-manno-octulosonate cytidylyltransferase (CMP-KDO synthetase)
MIEHVYRRASAAGDLDRVVVLTDDDRIRSSVLEFGGEVELTPRDCTSGTDRIAWAARSWAADAIVNIQGDEPLVDPSNISNLARHLVENPGDDMVTLACPASEGDAENPNVVKVVVDREGYALYFSRSPIPYPRSPGHAPVLRHIGLYGYQIHALKRLASLTPTPLEKTESLEQLRALENGIRIRVLETTGAAPGIDTREDVARIEKLLQSE